MHKLPILTLLTSVIVIAGCGAQTAPLRVDARHPADPRAAEAPAASLVRLAPDAFDRAVGGEPRQSLADSAATSPNESHAMPSHHHRPGKGGPEAGAPAPVDSARSHAPDAAYVCPMHADVTDARASECPKCGMNLVRRKEKP